MAGVKQHISKKFTNNNKIQLVHGGKEYFDLLLQLIGQATDTIHLQTYIFGNDATGHRVADALKTAAKKGVKVYLLADGYASQSMPQTFIDALCDAGINFRFFEPLIKSKHFYFGRRLHHKIFVADAQYGLTGGVNIADRYNDVAGQPAWLDFGLYAEGEIAKEMCVLCWKTWKGFPVKTRKAPCTITQPINFKGAEPTAVRMRRNDWVLRKNQISGTYFEMLRHAQSHITIVCSYFLPGKIIRNLLSNAAKRGVKIKVVTAGPSDVAIAKHAERWMYDWLLRNNIELYEYQPAVLHAKVAVCDGAWFTIGSYNINNISAYASVEMNLDVRSQRYSKELESMIDVIIQNDSIAITNEAHLKTKNYFKQFVQWCSYQLIRVGFFLVTFYYRQRRR